MKSLKHQQERGSYKAAIIWLLRNPTAQQPAWRDAKQTSIFESLGSLKVMRPSPLNTFLLALKGYSDVFMYSCDSGLSQTTAKSILDLHL